MNALRILVADDDEDLREELASALGNDGYDVVEAADGNELLDALARTRGRPPGPGYDAIVMDLMMPEFTGIDVLTALNTPLERVPVLVITGSHDEHTLRKATALGALAVLRKPFALDELRTALANVLRHPDRPLLV